MLPIVHLAILLISPNCVMVPMDHKDPRLHFLIEDTELHFVIAKDDESVQAFTAAYEKYENTSCDFRNPKPPPACVSLESMGPLLEQDHRSPFCLSPPSPSAVASCYFTSGSTGRFKGCLVTHRSLAAYCRAKNNAHQISRGSVCFVASAPTFDPSFGDFCATWSAGGTVASADRNVIFTTLGLCLLATSATHVLTTPSLFNTLQDAFGPGELPSLKTIALGGEPMSQATVNTWSEHVRLLNTYGVTECCVYQAYARIRAGVTRKAIGKPLSGNQLLVMTNGGDPDKILETPASEMFPLSADGGKAESQNIGELWIAGNQVGVGYLKRPELTKQKFVDHPVYGPCFRTGDVVTSFENKGQIGWKILGRLDSQVKVRGQRIELEEIEQALLSHATSILLSKAAVVFHQESKQLVAYCVPQEADSYLAAPSKSKVLTSVLRGLCQTHLPAHMVPARFVLTSELLTTATGKIARSVLSKQVLPPLLWNTEEDTPLYGGWTKVVEAAWADVLGLQSGGASSAHFADLGGDSLAALRVCRKISCMQGKKGEDTAVDEFGNVFGELLGVLGPAELLKRPILREFAQYLQESFGDISPPSEERVPLTPDRWVEEPGSITSELQVSAGAGAATVVDFLLRKSNARPDGETAPSEARSNGSNRRTAPLHCACLNGHLEVAQVLISHNASVGFLDQTGATPLHLASHAGPPALITLLLDQQKKFKKGSSSPLHRLDDNRQTPLHHAARSGAPAAVLTLLLNESPNPATVLEMRDTWGRTALHWAVVNGHRNAVSVLLEWGADRKVFDSNGFPGIFARRSDVNRMDAWSRYMSRQWSASAVSVSSLQNIFSFK
ncbi:hypothetical protein DFJ77DRAFT_3476 [Powellomyces hirtus]|nr:hypothetical protein DFJ77DRAFT_3476 [Powellomyces hirtus]